MDYIFNFKIDKALCATARGLLEGFTTNEEFNKKFMELTEVYNKNAEEKGLPQRATLTPAFNKGLLSTYIRCIIEDLADGRVKVAPDRLAEAYFRTCHAKTKIGGDSKL